MILAGEEQSPMCCVTESTSADVSEIHISANRDSSPEPPSCARIHCDVKLAA